MGGRACSEGGIGKRRDTSAAGAVAVRCQRNGRFLRRNGLLLHSRVQKCLSLLQVKRVEELWQRQEYSAEQLCYALQV